MKKAALYVLFFAAALGLLYLADNETEPMTDAVRAGAGVATVRSDGLVTAYESGGDGRAGTVVLIHGANGPAFVWDRNVAALQAAGFRTLRYDIFGRGYSDRPPGAPYDLAFYTAQLRALIAHVRPPGPVHLVGNSMGAILAAEYAVRHGDEVGRVVLIGPAGFPIENPAVAFVDVPLVAEYVMHALGDRLILAANRKYFFDPESRDARDFLARYEKQMKYRGLKNAMLRTMQRLPMQDFGEGYRALGASAKPVLLIWGRGDRTFPFEHNTRAREWMPGAELFAVDRAGHLPQYERPDAVNARLVPFLRAGH